LLFDLNINETSTAHVIQLYKVSRKSFINVLIKMTTSIRLFLSRDMLACKDLPLDTLHRFLTMVT